MRCVQKAERFDVWLSGNKAIQTSAMLVAFVVRLWSHVKNDVRTAFASFFLATAERLGVWNFPRLSASHATGSRAKLNAVKSFQVVIFGVIM